MYHFSQAADFFPLLSLREKRRYREILRHCRVGHGQRRGRNICLVLEVACLGCTANVPLPAGAVGPPVLMIQYCWLMGYSPDLNFFDGPK